MSRYRALAKALSGWAILTLGVTLSIAIAQAVGSRTETGPAFIRVSQAVLVTLFVVPAIVACRRLLDRRTLAGMGLSRHWPAAAAIGVAVAVVTGAVVWTPVFLIGWARFDHLEPVALATFLAVNAVVLLLYEALPEEIALRGYGWSTLRESWGPLAATMTITVLFCLSTAFSNLIRMTSTLVLGGGTTGFSLAPSGNDPFFYIVLLFVFGLTLVAARRIPLPGALTSAIASISRFSPSTVCFWVVLAGSTPGSGSSSPRLRWPGSALCTLRLPELSSWWCGGGWNAAQRLYRGG